MKYLQIIPLLGVLVSGAPPLDPHGILVDPPAVQRVSVVPGAPGPAIVATKWEKIPLSTFSDITSGYAPWLSRLWANRGDAAFSRSAFVAAPAGAPELSMDRTALALLSPDDALILIKYGESRCLFNQPETAVTLLVVSENEPHDEARALVGCSCVQAIQGVINVSCPTLHTQVIINELPDMTTWVPLESAAIPELVWAGVIVFRPAIANEAPVTLDVTQAQALAATLGFRMPRVVAPIDTVVPAREVAELESSEAEASGNTQAILKLEETTAGDGTIEVEVDESKLHGTEKIEITLAEGTEDEKPEEGAEKLEITLADGTEDEKPEEGAEKIEITLAEGTEDEKLEGAEKLEITLAEGTDDEEELEEVAEKLEVTLAEGTDEEELDEGTDKEDSEKDNSTGEEEEDEDEDEGAEIKNADGEDAEKDEESKDDDDDEEEEGPLMVTAYVDLKMDFTLDETTKEEEAPAATAKVSLGSTSTGGGSLDMNPPLLLQRVIAQTQDAVGSVL